MNDTLIDKLTKLELEEKCIKRNLDRYYRNENDRSRLFYRLKDIKKEKEQIKFKLRLKKEMKNEEFR